MSGAVLFWLVVWILWRIFGNRSKSSHYRVSSPWFLIVWLVVVSFLPWSLAELVEGHWGFALPAILCTVLLLPWPITRALAVPRGWVRTAYRLTWLANLTWRRDLRGGALTAAMLACRRRRPAAAGTAAWLEARLGDLTPLGAAGALAGALYTDLTGEREQAAEQMRAVLDFPPEVSPGAARRLACEWLAAEAAARGEWAAVRRWATGRYVTQRSLALLDAVAARLLGAYDAPGRAVLTLRWCLAPRRRATQPLFERALAPGAEPATTAADDGDRGGPDDDPLARALARHIGVAGAPAARRDADTVAALDRAWQRALGAPSFAAWLDRRAAALGAEPAAVRAALEDDLEQAFEALLEGAPAWPEVATGALLGAAARRRRDRLLEDLEAALDALAERTAERRRLAPAFELAELCAVERLFAAIRDAGDPGSTYAAFSPCFRVLVNHAAWLYNKRRETVLANAVFRWLALQAEQVGDEAALRLADDNLGCGL